MAYSSDQLPSGLEAITSTATGDVMVVGDADDSGRAKKITRANMAADTETLTNKTIDADNNTISNLAPSMADTTGADVLFVTGTAGTNGNTGQWNADGDLVDGKALPSGDIVGTTDTQTLTNKDISNANNTYRSASTTVSGAVEIATAAEINTGTDAGRAVSPDTLAGSNLGTRMVSIQIFPGGTDTATGDGASDQRFFVPTELAGMNIVSVAAAVTTAGTTGTLDIQIHNVTSAADILSTKITIDSGEKTSYTAATPPVINSAEDDVAAGDELRFDIDAVHTTPAKGLIVILGFQLP